MKIIINHWLNSFLLFSPLKFKAFIFSSFKRFLIALKTVLSRFGFLLLVDLFLFAMFGKVIFKIIHHTAQTTPLNVSLSMILVLLLIEVNWFIFSSTMLLFIRKKEAVDPLHYLKESFFSYLQLLMFFYFLIFIGMTIIVALGITKFPPIHWTLLAIHTIVKFLTTFYWLDSRKTFTDIFLACEKAINCFFYNLPIFIFFIAIIWGIDAGFSALFGQATKTIGLNTAIFFSKTEQIIKACPEQITLVKFLALRYALFFIKHLWTSFVFVFYDQKKGISYTSSCLDALSKAQPPL